jgi:hypothetical protein
MKRNPVDYMSVTVGKDGELPFNSPLAGGWNSVLALAG